MRVEREKEIEDKRKQDEERQRLEVIKAKAIISAPKQVGTIDLNPQKVVIPVSKPVVAVTPKVVAPKAVAPKVVVEKPVLKEIPKKID